ncbi:MAG: sigma-54 dependent transcriptional regulator [Acidobacteriota bacterium]
MSKILLVEDKESLRTMLQRTLESEGYAVDAARDGNEALEKLRRHRYLLMLTDLRLPGHDGIELLKAAVDADAQVPVIVMTAYGSIEEAVRAMKLGAFDFLAKPFDNDHLLLLVQRAIEQRQLQFQNLVLREEWKSRLGFPRIVGESPALAEATISLRKVGPTDVTVLLTGESGTGKELFARALHELSPRKEGAFIAINCAAIPDTLLENELFGHEKGAYTGAGTRKLGKLEMAHRGTLFLDEIGELSPAVQGKLLRVLEERVFERVGGTAGIEIDVRIVAATNKDLKAAVAEKHFRADLFFRLSVFPIEIPPLRSRREDIPRLAEHFVSLFTRDMKKRPMTVDPAAMQMLCVHAWPGNVRELQNCVERAVILAEGGEILPEHLNLPRDGHAGAERDLRSVISLDGTLTDVLDRGKELCEKVKIEMELRRAKGNLRQASDALGLTPKALAARIKELGLEGPS